VLKLTHTKLNQTKISFLAIPVCEDADIHEYGTIQELVKKAGCFQEFQGKKDQELELNCPDETGFQRVMCMGVGKLNVLDAEIFRKMAGKAVRSAIKKKMADVVIVLPAVGKIPVDMPDLITAVSEGACLGNDVFDLYKSEKKIRPLDRIHLWAASEVVNDFQRLPSRIESVCEGTLTARRWVSMPPNEKKPEAFTRTIVTEAEKAGLQVTVLDEKQLQKDGFGGIMAVSSGSLSHPRMVVLDYCPEHAGQTVVLVGKGVTFDAGGINLKPSTSLEDMKMDMAGAAAVAATLITLARTGCRHRVIGVLPIVENMPSGNASCPGDIIRTYNGKTVEIGNTDAEGRLILADAMAYAVEHCQPAVLIDAATLTGACVTALGEQIAGVFSPDDNLAQQVCQSGEKTNERCWRMPLPDDYRVLLKSDFADINNMSRSRWGGAITAALFLSEFVGNVRWAHIDIAGPAYAKKESTYCGAGGTGFGVRLLWDVVQQL